jgi:hypothetical protein
MTPSRSEREEIGKWVQEEESKERLTVGERLEGRDFLEKLLLQQHLNSCFALFGVFFKDALIRIEASSLLLTDTSLAWVHRPRRQEEWESSERKTQEVKRPEAGHLESGIKMRDTTNNRIRHFCYFDFQLKSLTYHLESFSWWQSSHSVCVGWERFHPTLFTLVPQLFSISIMPQTHSNQGLPKTCIAKKTFSSQISAEFRNDDAGKTESN